MIPRKLRIRNFLSYRDCDLDLTGLRLAVLCGPNGHGKSALLDAMTWALWGEGRGRLEDDRIHLGEQEMLVDFQFDTGDDTFQVVRKRTRGRASGSLDFLQVTPEGGRTPLTGGTVSETQAEIIRKLRMDYDTFVNSAFIVQGRSNEFTRKRAAERKEVFRNVLGLQRYQELADAALERRKDAASRLKDLERNTGEAHDEITHLPAVEAEIARIESERTSLAPRCDRLQDEVVQLKQAASDHARLQREALDGLQRVESLRTAIASAEQELTELSADLDSAREALEHGDQVRAAHARLGSLREEEHAFAAVQQQARGFETQLSDAERTISVERARIESELGAVRRTLEDAEAAAASIEALERDQGALQRQRAEITGLEERSAKLEHEAAADREKAGRLGEKANMVATQNRELKEREAQLETAEASCPVCLKPLAPGDLGHVRVEYARKREELRAQYEQAHAAKAETLNRAESALAHATRLRDDARRRELALRERERELDAKLPAARQAKESLPQLRAAADNLETTLAQERFAAAARDALSAAHRALADLGYDAAAHGAVRDAIATLVSAEADYQALLVAGERAVALEARIARERESLAARCCELQEAEGRLIRARDELALAEDVQPRLDAAEEALDAARNRDSELAMQLGKLHAQHDALKQLESRIAMAQDEICAAKDEESLFGDLSNAFGRNGIQAMLIDQSLPRVEHTANDMLDRMTGGRIHVSLATQRQSASGRVTETLDIRISDEVGTRDYEMYSGGEAFRVDFALRIALARLLAERAGASLPTLIIDEGFGTQDAEGIDRLVQAITAIQDEFRLILVVTHIDELKERFERRIEVAKDPRRGSLARVI